MSRNSFFMLTILRKIKDYAHDISSYVTMLLLKKINLCSNFSTYVSQRDRRYRSTSKQDETITRKNTGKQMFGIISNDESNSKGLFASKGGDFKVS